MWGVLLVAMVLASPLERQEGATDCAVGSAKGLKVSVELDKARCHEREPISVSAVLENVSSHDIVVDRDWYDPNTNTLEISDGQGRKRPARVLWETTPPPREAFITLHPHEKSRSAVEVTEENYAPLEAGTYRVTIRYENVWTAYFSKKYPYRELGKIGAWTGCVRSEPASVVVTK